MFAIEPNVVWVLSGATITGVLLGVLGSFLILRREALLGDAVAHAALPGVVCAFFMTASRHPGVLMVGALLTCLLGNLSISALKHHRIVREDSALAIVLVGYFALGIVLLTVIQGSGMAQQSGLDRLLFGQAAGLKQSDLQLVSIVTLLTLCLVFVVFERLRLITFDPDFATSLGFSVRWFESLLSLFVGLALVLSLQLVGVILVAALLIIPAATARLLTDRFAVFVFGSAVLGGFAGLVGAVLSGSIENAPTGPLIVLVSGTVFLLAIFGSPKHGFLPLWIRRLKQRRNIQEEDLLRQLYRMEESAPSDQIASEEVRNQLHASDANFRRALHRLCTRNEIRVGESDLALTDTGRERARKLTRYHRLWEAFLVEETAIPKSHVHADAEEIEHFLTPELEAELLDRLQHAPVLDPHGQEIPKKDKP